MKPVRFEVDKNFDIDYIPADSIEDSKDKISNNQKKVKEIFGKAIKNINVFQRSYQKIADHLQDNFKKECSQVQLICSELRNKEDQKEELTKILSSVEDQLKLINKKHFDITKNTVQSIEGKLLLLKDNSFEDNNIIKLSKEKFKHLKQNIDPEILVFQNSTKGVIEDFWDKINCKNKEILNKINILQNYFPESSRWDDMPKKLNQYNALKEERSSSDSLYATKNFSKNFTIEAFASLRMLLSNLNDLSENLHKGKQLNEALLIDINELCGVHKLLEEKLKNEKLQKQREDKFLEEYNLVDDFSFDERSEESWIQLKKESSYEVERL